jgi:hypothetical protein
MGVEMLEAIEVVSVETVVMDKDMAEAIEVVSAETMEVDTV